MLSFLTTHLSRTSSNRKMQFLLSVGTMTETMRSFSVSPIYLNELFLRKMWEKWLECWFITTKLTLNKRAFISAYRQNTKETSRRLLLFKSHLFLHPKIGPNLIYRSLHKSKSKLDSQKDTLVMKVAMDVKSMQHLLLNKCAWKKLNK